MDITSFKELKSFICSDAYRYYGDDSFAAIVKIYFSEPAFRYVFWMRICARLHCSRLLKPLMVYAKPRLKGLSFKTGIQVPYYAQIGKGLYIGHFGTVIVSCDAVLGSNINLSPGVVIGQSNRGSKKGVPVLGNNIYIGPGAKVIGKITIGNNVAIGANAVVTGDVPEGSCVAGIPAKVISMKGSEGYVNRTVE